MVGITTGRKFQYGGRSFSKTGSSYISAVNRYIDEIWFADIYWLLQECNGLVGWLVGWCRTALSAQKSCIMPEESNVQQCNKTANINVKKLQFRHELTASDTSKTAKITKR